VIGAKRIVIKGWQKGWQNREWKSGLVEKRAFPGRERGREGETPLNIQ